MNNFIFEQAYAAKLVEWEIEGGKDTDNCYKIIECLNNENFNKIIIKQSKDEKVNNWIIGYCKLKGGCCSPMVSNDEDVANYFYIKNKEAVECEKEIKKVE